MKRILFSLALSAALFSGCDLLDTAGITEKEIVDGLKEALRIGSENSAASAHKTDGYFGNSLIKIPFPKEAQKVADVVSVIPGGNTYISNVVLSLNRAAEDAAIEAKPIFVDAIMALTIDKGLEILQGDSVAATNYLQSTTRSPLKDKFLPKIKASLDKVNATKFWADIMGVYNNIPLVQPINADLPDYATNKALDGLFVLVGQEESKIRRDPAARVTDILKKVFTEENMGK